MTFSFLTQKSASPSLVHAEAFSQFYERNHLDVFKYLMVLCGGVQDEAEDLTAETFLRAWHKRHHFTGDDRAALAWVLTIARHALIDRRRYEQVRPEAAELEDPLMEDALPADDLTAEELFIHEEQMQAVLDGIRQLPVARREILTLRYGLGWRVNQIARHLHVTENAVSVDLRRALKSLQLSLAPKRSQ